MIGPLKLVRALRAVARITADPTKLDEVFVLADVSEESPQIDRLLAELRADPVHRLALQSKPRLGEVSLASLSRLPEGTLGRAYARFMTDRGLSHEDLVLVEGESDMDWMRNHLRETHDLWHVATGFDTDVAGELGVQAFYLAQLKGPLPVLLLAVGMLNTLFKGMDDADRRMRAITRGWLLGRRGASLFGTAWSERWGEPLESFRRAHRLDLDAVDRFLEESEPAEVLAAAA